MFAAIGSMILMRVGVCFVLTTDMLPFKMGAMGFWIAMCADWVARSILFMSRLLSGRWKKSSGLLKEVPAVPIPAATVGGEGAEGLTVEESAPEDGEEKENGDVQADV